MIFAFIRAVRGDLPGPMAVISYRSSFLGSQYGPVFQHAMRKTEHWTLAEAELFAAWVSLHNECAY